MHKPWMMDSEGLNLGLSFCLSAMSLLILSRMRLAMALPSILSATMIVCEKERAWILVVKLPVRVVGIAAAAGRAVEESDREP